MYIVHWEHKRVRFEALTFIFTGYGDAITSSFKSNFEIYLFRCTADIEVFSFLTLFRTFWKPLFNCWTPLLRSTEKAGIQFDSLFISVNLARFGFQSLSHSSCVFFNQMISEHIRAHLRRNVNNVKGKLNDAQIYIERNWRKNSLVRKDPKNAW